MTTQKEQNYKHYADLYIVATPIGNIKDITLRALEILQNVDVIICEDTRVTQKLLSSHSIKSSMISYNDHSSDSERNKILGLLNNGKKLALVSDAGTPLISDPGYKLVNKAREAGFTITTLPGACSAIAALTLSGLPTDNFYFHGFLPPKSGQRINKLKSLKETNATIIFMETGKRLIKCLEDLHKVFGDTQACIVREISKKFEQTKQDSLNKLISFYQQSGPPKGEIILLVKGQTDNNNTLNIEEELERALQKVSLKDAVSLVSEITGVSKKIVYDKALSLRKQQ